MRPSPVIDFKHVKGNERSVGAARLLALHSRNWAAQECEASIGVAVLNRMTEAGRPNSVRTGGANA
jgi:hypothetical protein